MSVKLVKIIDFKEQNEAVTLGEGTCVVGRGKDAAVTLNDKRCSSKQAILHLKIVKQQIEFTITPTGTNPCYVYKNKTKKPIKLTKDEKYKLFDNDVICFVVLEHKYLCKFENPKNNEEKKVKKKSEKEISDEDENIKEDEEENEKSDGDEELLNPIIGDTKLKTQLWAVGKSVNVLAEHEYNENEEVKEIFSLLQKEQSADLAEMIKSSSLLDKIKDAEFVKKQIFLGSIPMCGWSSQWEPIHESNETLERQISQQKEVIVEKERQLRKIEQEIKDIRNNLLVLQQQKEVKNFYDEFLLPIVRTEKELSRSFQSKVEKASEFSVDDVCFFLNLSGLHELVAVFRENQITGSKLILFSEISDIEGLELGIKDVLVEKKLEFHAKLLETNAFFNKEELEKSIIWRHRSPKKTVDLLKDYEIALSAEIILQKEISIGQLIYFKVKDFKEIFRVSVEDAALFVKKLQNLKINFEKFIYKSEPIE